MPAERASGNSFFFFFFSEIQSEGARPRPLFIISTAKRPSPTNYPISALARPVLICAWRERAILSTVQCVPCRRETSRRNRSRLPRGPVRNLRINSETRNDVTIRTAFSSMRNASNSCCSASSSASISPLFHDRIQCNSSLLGMPSFSSVARRASFRFFFFFFLNVAGIFREFSSDLLFGDHFFSRNF